MQNCANCVHDHSSSFNSVSGCQDLPGLFFLDCGTSECLSEKYLFLKLLSVRSERLCAGGRSFSTTAIVSAAFFPNKPADRRSFHAEPFVGFFLSTARRFHRRITPLFCACSWLPDSSRLPARSAVSPTHEGYGPRFPSPRSAHSQSCSGHDSALARCPIVTRRSPTPLRGDDDATPETRHCLPPVARGLAPNPSPPSTDASPTSPTPFGSLDCESPGQTTPSRSCYRTASVISSSPAPPLPHPAHRSPAPHSDTQNPPRPRSPIPDAQTPVDWVVCPA